jgi:hypothetical protein
MKIEPMIQKRKEFLKVSYQTIDNIDGSYQGECAFDKPHGKGFITFINSIDYSKFDGHCIAGKFYDGTLIYKNGDSFTGLFRDGRRYNGTLTFANGGYLLKSKETRR